MTPTTFFQRKPRSKSLIHKSGRNLHRVSERSGAATPKASKPKADDPFWRAVGGGIFFNDTYLSGAFSPSQLICELVQRRCRASRVSSRRLDRQLICRPRSVADEVVDLITVNYLSSCKGAEEIINTITSNFHMFGADREIEHALTIMTMLKGVCHTLLGSLVFLTDEWLAAYADSANWIMEGVSALVNQHPFCLPPLCLWSLGQRQFAKTFNERIGMAWSDRRYTGPTSAHQIWHLILDSFFTVREFRPRKSAHKRPLRSCTEILWPLSSVSLCQSALTYPSRSQVQKCLGGFLSAGDAATLLAMWHSTMESAPAPQILSSALHFALIPHSLNKLLDVPKAVANEWLESLDPPFYHARHFAARNVTWLIAASTRKQDKVWWQEAAHILGIDRALTDGLESTRGSVSGFADTLVELDSALTDGGSLMDTMTPQAPTEYSRVSTLTPSTTIPASESTIYLDCSVGATSKPQKFGIGTTVSAPCGIAPSRKSWLTCRMRVPPPVTLDPKGMLFAYVLANATESKLHHHRLGVLAPCILQPTGTRIAKGLAYDFVSGLAYEVTNEHTLELSELKQRAVTSKWTRPFLMQTMSAAAFVLSVNDSEITWSAQKVAKLRLPIVWNLRGSEPLTFFLTAAPFGAGLTGDLEGSALVSPPAIRFHCYMAPTGSMTPRHFTSTKFTREIVTKEGLDKMVGVPPTAASPALRSRVSTRPPSPLKGSVSPMQQRYAMVQTAIRQQRRGSAFVRASEGSPLKGGLASATVTHNKRTSTSTPLRTLISWTGGRLAPHLPGRELCALCSAPAPDWRNGVTLLQEKRNSQFRTTSPRNWEFNAGEKTLRAWQMLPQHMDFGAPGRLQRFRGNDRRMGML